MNIYRVVKDRQGGTFGMGRAWNAKQWLEQAVEWRDSDDSWGDYGPGTDCYGEKHLDSREWFVQFWTKMIEDDKEQKLIDYIAEIWDLEFEKVPQKALNLYNEYVANYYKYHTKPDEPVCLAEWLDNEWREIEKPIDK